MGTKKLSFKDISNVLSRAELKNIMAGSSGGGPGGGGGGGGCPIPCAPNCNNSVLIYCRNSSGANIGTVLGNTCDHEGQLQECWRVYPTTVSTNSDCLC
ncbi:MAG: hypothetical protein JWP37_2732 [Mucilaginibacter sp.]|jgi:hypothetical protein|nr:hypothetical protein [Mucilaginibacter sp.]